MRIALVVHKFPPSSLGGTEVYTQNLARELATRGHEVAVFFRAEPPGVTSSGREWEEREGFRALRVWRGFDLATASAPARFLDTFYNPDIEAAFERFLDEVQPELVHFQHVMWLSFRLIAMARRRKLPTLLTLHDYWFLCANSQLIWPDHRTCQGKNGGLNCARCALEQVHAPVVPLLQPLITPAFWVRDALVRRAAFSAERWIAPSHFLIQQYVKAGFPATRFTCLENGIDTSGLAFPERPPRPDGKLRVTYLGSLAWQKGVHVAVEAMHGISPSAARLQVYGDPAAFADYARLLQSGADSDNTTFHGALVHSEVGRVLAQTDVLVVPSLWYENSPLVIQEAFAAGVPVVASDIGALAEKVHPGIDGWLCPPGDVPAWREVLLRLAEHPEEVARARAGVKPPLTLREHVSRLEELYARP
jgi:glycosyltransferase involved in cell wall biosynthesis